MSKHFSGCRYYHHIFFIYDNAHHKQRSQGPFLGVVWSSLIETDFIMLFHNHNHRFVYVVLGSKKALATNDHQTNQHKIWIDFKRLWSLSSSKNQVPNHQKGVSSTLSFKLMHMYLAPAPLQEVNQAIQACSYQSSCYLHPRNIFFQKLEKYDRQT